MKYSFLKNETEESHSKKAKFFIQIHLVKYHSKLWIEFFLIEIITFMQLMFPIYGARPGNQDVSDERPDSWDFIQL